MHTQYFRARNAERAFPARHFDPRAGHKAPLEIVKPKPLAIAPAKPIAEPQFTPLIQEFLDECGYSE